MNTDINTTETETTLHTTMNTTKPTETAQAKSLPAAFVRYWQQLVAKFADRRKAYIALKEAWFAGRTIPGYEGVWRRCKLPRNWSYRNLAKLTADK